LLESFASGFAKVLRVMILLNISKLSCVKSILRSGAHYLYNRNNALILIGLPILNTMLKVRHRHKS
jgi:hypothetical protein